MIGKENGGIKEVPFGVFRRNGDLSRFEFLGTFGNSYELEICSRNVAKSGEFS